MARHTIAPAHGPDAVVAALRDAGGNRSHAARALGVHRSTMTAYVRVARAGGHDVPEVPLGRPRGAKDRQPRQRRGTRA